MDAAIEQSFEEEVAFLKQLIGIRSENPPGDNDQAAEQIAKLITELGFEVEAYPVPEPFVRQHGMTSITNLIVRQKFGDGNGPTIALNSYADVVGAGEGWSSNPFEAKISDDKIFGRGAVIAKSDIASYLFALKALKKCSDHLQGQVELHVTFDGEMGGHVGPKWLLEQGLSTPDYAITTGFSYEVVRAHNGCLHLEVICRGRQAHAAKPELGCDALEGAHYVLSALYKERKRLLSISSETEGIAGPRLTVGVIEGGIHTNVVPERVAIKIDRRLTPEEAGEDEEEALVALIEKSVPVELGVEVECRRLMLAEPLRVTPAQDTLTNLLYSKARSCFGESVTIQGAPLFTDARHYAEAGVPTVVYGAGPETLAESGAHGIDEHLRMNDLKGASWVVATALYDLLK
ncbi:ArgE/DapE family deacylase [Polycladidibacter stylochi]|uniref:ArgE/DapE family deacylase n=1 Tax=Polycladidibacter stylochi TaxID=1807766 RepID=UPI00083529CC|nr:ArgE/DapE family deacylase [Pseudovibrio stylochi]